MGKIRIKVKVRKTKQRRYASGSYQGMFVELEHGQNGAIRSLKGREGTEWMPTRAELLYLINKAKKVGILKGSEK